jgi:ferric-dicitrate binding protein FerR (iron transport regulator)
MHDRTIVGNQQGDMTTRLTAPILAALAVLAFAPSHVLAAAKIGVAAAIKNDVQRVGGGGAQQLSVGSDLFTSERIRTGEASAAQILLIDKTTLTVGPRAELSLDSFVYEPSQSRGRVVLNAVKGAFRFITGSQTPRSYTIKTPVGSIGVRGTIVDLLVSDTRIVVVLVQGSLAITVNGVIYTLDKPGTSYSFGKDGSVSGPAAYDGTIVDTSGDLSFPLYGWRFPGEAPNNGLPSTNIGSIDQLNGVIQRSLTAPVVAPPQSPGTGNNYNR